jgi:two-component system chemotaxis response regulator CheY
MLFIHGVGKMKTYKFVIVDDSSFMRTILRKIVEKQNHYKVAGEGSTGNEAIKLAIKFKPDILTLDITMPNMDGIQAVSEILNVSPHTKIIMISAMGQEKKIVDAIKAGARDFIIKPFEENRVLEAIKKVLN